MPELPQIIANGGINVPRPERAPEGGAFRPLANEAENMKFIARNAMRDEEVGQVSSAIGDFMLQRDDIQRKLSTVTNPDAYLAHYQDSLTAANNDILSRFSSSPMKDRLAGELKIHMAESLSSATAHATALQVKAGQDAINTALKTYAPVAATSPDPKDRDYAEHQAFGLIQSNKYTTEDEKALQWQAFNKSVDIMGLQSRIDQGDPSVMVELASPKFAQNHPLLPPEARKTLSDYASAMLRLPGQQLEAQHAAASAKAMNDLIAKAGTGNLSAAEVQHAYDASLIDERQFKQLLPGQKPQEPSDPALIKSVTDEIDKNPNAYSRFDILSLRANSRDTALMQSYLTKAQEDSKKTINASALQVGARLRGELFPASMLVINPKARAAQISQFNEDWKSIVETAKTPKDLYDGAETLRKLYGGGRRSKPPPPRLPGETDAAWGARIRAAGGM